MKVDAGKPVVVIIDYGAGNLASVQNALDSLGAEWEVSSDPAAIRSAKARMAGPQARAPASPLAMTALASSS